MIEYIGDGVYTIIDGNGVELRTDDHEFPSNTIVLENSVMDKLIAMYKEKRK